MGKTKKLELEWDTFFFRQWELHSDTHTHTHFSTVRYRFSLSLLSLSHTHTEKLAGEHISPAGGLSSSIQNNLPCLRRDKSLKHSLPTDIYEHSITLQPSKSRFQRSSSNIDLHVGFISSLTTLTLKHSRSHTAVNRSICGKDVGVRCDVREHGAVEEDLDLRSAPMGGDRDSRGSSDCAHPLPIVSLHHRLAPPQQRQGQARPSEEARRWRRDYSRRVQGNPGDLPRVHRRLRRRSPPNCASGIMIARSNFVLWYLIWNCVFLIGLFLLFMEWTFFYAKREALCEVEKGIFVNELLLFFGKLSYSARASFKFFEM